MTTTDIATSSMDVQQIMGEALPEIEDTEQAQRAIVERILTADSLQDLFADTTTTATRDMVGIPVEISDCRLMRSTVDGSRGVYMLLDATNLETGEVCPMNTGSPNIMATVWRARQLDQLPIQVTVVEVAAARNGRNAPLGIRPTGKTLQALTSKAGK